jgi:hypothetical protein
MKMMLKKHHLLRGFKTINKIHNTPNQNHAKKLLAKLCHCLDIGNDARLKGLEYVLAINDKIEVFEW